MSFCSGKILYLTLPLSAVVRWLVFSQVISASDDKECSASVVIPCIEMPSNPHFDVQVESS